MDDGTDKPIAFASHSAEMNYAQLACEALSKLNFDNISLVTDSSDHKLLKYRYKSGSNTTMGYNPGGTRLRDPVQGRSRNTDVLSRILLPDVLKSIPTLGETILLMQSLQATPVNSKQIEK